MRVELDAEALRIAQLLVDSGAYPSLDGAVNALVLRAAPAPSNTDDPEVGRRQYQAHLRLLERVRALDEQGVDDGLSGADHDQILYSK